MEHSGTLAASPLPRSLFEVCETLELASGCPVDFIGKSNIWIDDVNEADSVVLMRSIVCEAIAKTAPGQLRMMGYDSMLSGAFAPFAMLSSGEKRQLDLVESEDDLKTKLGYLKQQIQGVQNVIQARESSLTEFRQRVQWPVESYQLIILVLDMGMIDVNLRALIALLMKSGPAAGVSFLIVSTTIPPVNEENLCLDLDDIDDVESFSLNFVKCISSNVTLLKVEGNTVHVLGARAESAKFFYTPKTALECLETVKESKSQAQKAALPIVCFDDLHGDDIKTPWTQSSIDGVMFTVGKYGANDLSITLGDEINQRHNALITGAVGQGKSNLLSVIVHSLCLRYSPEELALYLLDFKEGVTFKPFSNIGKEDYLPHVKTLGLESDVDFGIAVLNSLFEEYKRRMKVFKDADARNIKELRVRNSAVEMPRIVVIIDEFQMMFGDEGQTGQLVVDMLEKSVRLFRAAGIHFILSSQTLGGNMVLAQKRDCIFGQVPIRIALKNSISESRETLALDNPAAAFLRPREAIVNLDYGEVSQNRKTIIAFADEKLLAPLRHTWWEEAKSTKPAPYIFESERRITVRESMQAIRKARRENDAPVAFIGDRISVDGLKVQIPLPSEPGRNMAIIGSPDAKCNHAVGIVQSAAVSLAYQHPEGNARFVMCDFTNTMPFGRRYSHFSELIESTGAFVEDVAPADFASFLEKLLDDAQQQTKPVYVFGLGMDRWEYEKDPYSQGSPLKTFVETGPAKGLHFIGWWVKASSFTGQVAGYGTSDAFNTKIFLRIDERAVQSLIDPFARWSAQPNRALMSDKIEHGSEIPFIPYAPLKPGDTALFRSVVW